MKKRIAALSTLIILIALFSLDSLALSGEALDEDSKTKYISNIRLKFVCEADDKTPIECFDVSDGGNIAILSDVALFSSDKTVRVLDENGVFKYGYDLRAHGSAYVVFDGELLMIYFVRGDTAIWLDDKGNCVKAENIKSASADQRFTDYAGKTHRVKNGLQYSLKSQYPVLNFFLYHYSRIEKRTPAADDEGEPEVTIIYQADGALNKYYSALLLFILFLNVAGFLIIFIHVKRIKRISASKTINQ